MTIGETLGAARRRRGLTVDELSAQTRVRDHIIEAIEQDEFSECGGAFYARGHIRSLARSLGVADEPLIEEFDSTHAAAVGPSLTEIFATRGQAAAAERPRVHWLLLMAAACVIAAVVIAVYGYLNNDSAEVHTASAVTDSAGDGAGAGGPTEERDHTSGDRDPAEGDRENVDDAADDAAADAAEDGGAGDADADNESDSDASQDEAPQEEATLRIQAQERTWVSVTDGSGADLFTGIMHDGDERDWADTEELTVVVGNIGGVTVEANDEKANPTPGPGGVTRLTVTPDGVE